MSLQRIECALRAGRVSFRGCDPREMLPCRSKVRPQPRRPFECGARLGPAVANERTPVEQLVTQLEPSQEESRVALGHGAQRVESCIQGQLCGANQTGVRTRQRIRVSQNSPYAIGVLLDAQPTLDLRHPPETDPAARVGGDSLLVRGVRLLPLCLADELLRLEELSQSFGRVGEGARRQRCGEWAAIAPDAEHDLVTDRVTERGPTLEWDVKFGRRNPTGEAQGDVAARHRHSRLNNERRRVYEGDMVAQVGADQPSQ